MAEFFDQAARKPLLAYVPTWIHPNHLTFTRAALLAPVIVFRSNPVLAVGFITLSSICDILDGPLARLRGQTSQWGALLDTASDKVFVLGALFFACDGRVPLWVRAAILVGEILLLGVRPLKRWLGAPMNSNAWGAVKTWCQSIAIGFVLSTIPWLNVLSLFVFGAAIFCSVGSLVFHLRDIKNRKIS